MISLRLRAAVATAVLAVLAFPSPAQARPAGHPWDLKLAVQDERTGAVARAELICHPTGGDHPQVQAACEALDAASGNLNRLAGTTGTLCYHLSQPVTASATGSWAGLPVQWQQTFGNSCELRTKTAPVFAF
ncbi:hypothetical protein P3T37_005924 [Kitasatospora sp. MAA4]|uniref:SSI family serine proteinase inhibitor n=1 Tax=Kitasatospora sp. MAA4 TaxID=3035093 RepID=UPI00247637A3|nr:SSI family serine proteinase inhibitor [Kitasatospora sp. MAA4]MDH6136496.1 hypothetical protein [Kitasatospora sp. MAA4]